MRYVFEPIRRLRIMAGDGWAEMVMLTERFERLIEPGEKYWSTLGSILIEEINEYLDDAAVDDGSFEESSE